MSGDRFAQSDHENRAELAHYGPPAAPAMRDVIDGWAAQVADIATLADIIANTAFVPGSYRGNAAAVAAAILAGREVGIGPMTALQHLHVIDGRPAMSAQLMRALVLAAGHTIRVQESTMARCILVGARRGGVEQSVTWTMDDARRAGVAGRPSWGRYPRQMLLARATGELCRAVFPDVLGGMGYTHEEAAELDSAPDVPAVEPAMPAKTVRRTRKAATPKTPPPEDVQTEAPPPPAADPTPADPDPDENPPEFEDPAYGPPDMAGDEDTGALLTPGQRAHIMALCGQYGRLEPRSLRMRTVSGLVGRDVPSVAALTRREAHNVIDALLNLRTLPDPDAALSILVTQGWDHIEGTRPQLPLDTQGDSPEWTGARS